MISSKMPTPPALFSIGRWYESKPSMYGTQNKTRGAIE